MSKCLGDEQQPKPSFSGDEIPKAWELGTRLSIINQGRVWASTHDPARLNKKDGDAKRSVLNPPNLKQGLKLNPNRNTDLLNPTKTLGFEAERINSDENEF